MSEWQPIDTAPTDGRLVMLKRFLADGSKPIIGEGRFGLPSAEAPMQKPAPPDPLNRMSAADYAKEEEWRQE